MSCETENKFSKLTVVKIHFGANHFRREAKLSITIMENNVSISLLYEKQWNNLQPNL